MDLFKFLTEGSEFFKLNNINEHPVPFFIAFVVVIALIFFLINLVKKQKTKKTDTKMLVIGALCIAIAYVLSYVKLIDLPQGGSLTLASGLPIILFAYIYGPKHGLVAAFAYSLLQLTQGLYVVHIVQFLLDYPLAFTAFGLAGFFKKNIIPGIVSGYTVRLLCHSIAGVVFYAEYARDLGYAVLPYAIGYNAVFLIPEMILCIILVLIPQTKGMIKNLKNNKI